MIDIFISHASPDKPKAARLARAFKDEGFQVWWDAKSLRSGDSFSGEIREALDRAKCVVVLWSAASAKSKWVESEAYWAFTHSKRLHLARLDDTLDLPLPFNISHARSLAGWFDGTNSIEFRRLVDDIATGNIPVAYLLEPEMIGIEPGVFLMGSAENEVGFDEERPQHEVCIARPFAIGKYPVTFDEFDAFAKALRWMLPEDEDWGRGLRPAINVSWDDAVAYTRWLSEQTGRRYRLPTEGEWEYAARAGTDTPWCFEDNERSIGEYAWYWQNSGARTQPVGRKSPNPWGLHDVHGNVWEWVQDCWRSNYEGAPMDGSARETGDCGIRVLRGGSWGFTGASSLRSAVRKGEIPAWRDRYTGFRVAEDPDDSRVRSSEQEVQDKK